MPSILELQLPAMACAKSSRGEGLQVVDPLADADGMDRQAVFCRDGDQNAAARGAVQLGHDQPRHAGPLAEHLHLIHGVLASRCIEDQQHVVGRCGIELL